MLKIRSLILPSLLVFAAGLRLVLVALGWPFTNSDEGTIGLMARHIAYQGDLPIFFYGYHYMGAMEAYLGAAFFHLWGASLFTLRLGLILLILLFLLSMYALTSLLYTRSWALVTVAILSLGSSFLLFRELSAFGGRQEMLVLGSLMMLCAVWLALRYDASRPLRLNWWRILIYAAWGVCVGLGVWSDMLVLPFVAASGLLLLLFCWRELLRGGVLAIVLGLLLGGFALISYNLHAEPGQDSLSVLRGLHDAGSINGVAAGQTILQQLQGTFGTSLPMMTGSPLCPVAELSLFGPSAPATVGCTFFQLSWSLGYMLLLTSALVLAVLQGWRAWQYYRQDKMYRPSVVRQSARFLLLWSGLTGLCLYTFSGAPIVWPGIHASYLIGLLIVTPAVFWPLWIGMIRKRKHMSRLAGVRRVLCIGISCVLCILLLLGPILTFTQEVPKDQVANARQQALIDYLLQRGITHVYAGYWTCDRIVFVTNERIICAVLGPTLEPSHNRYEPYYQMVQADQQAGYVFEKTNERALWSAVEKKLTSSNTSYRVAEVAGYMVYAPVEAKRDG